MQWWLYDRILFFLILAGLSLHGSEWALHWDAQASLIVAHGLHCPVTCGILVSWPGIKPASPALEAQSLNLWTTRRVLLWHYAFLDTHSIIWKWWILLCVNYTSLSLILFIGRTDAKAEAPILWPLKEKTLMLGKIEGKRKWGQQTVRRLDSITNSMDLNLSKLRKIAKDRSLSCCSPLGHKESDLQT